MPPAGFPGEGIVKGLLERLDGALKRVERTLALIAGLLVIVLMIVVCVEVIGRSAFNRPLRGNLDIVSQLMAPLVALGIAYGQSEFANVRMTIISGRLRGRARWLSEVFALLIATAVAVVLALGSWRNFLRSWSGGSDTPDLGIPIWIGVGCVTFALVLLSLRLMLQLAEALRLVADPASDSTVFAPSYDAAKASMSE